MDFLALGLTTLTSNSSGVVLGGSIVFASLSFHFLRTNDGLQFVPKNAPTFAETYLDVRNFGASDWARHKTVIAAIVKAKKESIFEGSPVDTLSEAAGNVSRELGSVASGQGG